MVTIRGSARTSPKTRQRVAEPSRARRWARAAPVAQVAGVGNQHQSKIVSGR